jgi:hypothetical protein
MLIEYPGYIGDGHTPGREDQQNDAANDGK